MAIKRLFARHRGRYGSPRIADDLHEAGWHVSVNTVAKVMAEQHLVARPKKKRRSTTRQGKGRWRAPDLVKRHFGAERINQKWYGDGTEIETDEGKLQLDSVLDMGSRRIVGFAIGEHHDADLAYAALAMAIAVRGGKQNIEGVLVHTDQGAEFTSHTFRQACERCGITQSMGRPGSGLDNAVIESWHSTLEFELRALEHFETKAQARAALVDFIEDYNVNRKHSSLGMRPPIQHERDLREEHGSGRRHESPAGDPAWRCPRRRQGQALRVAYGQPGHRLRAPPDGNQPGPVRDKITTNRVSTETGEPQAPASDR